MSRHVEEQINPDGMIRPLESYAVASILGCGALCMAAVIVGLVAIALVKWL